MMTLQQIRNAKPCANGWRTLLESLGGSPPMDTVVSLGDIARSNGVSDAFWAIRCTDWPAIRNTMRDEVLNPLVARAYADAATAAAYAAAAAAAEREKQRADIIAAFPPLHS
jgi:hypothetical protein